MAAWTERPRQQVYNVPAFERLGDWLRALDKQINFVRVSTEVVTVREFVTLWSDPAEQRINKGCGNVPNVSNVLCVHGFLNQSFHNGLFAKGFSVI